MKALLIETKILFHHNFHSDAQTKEGYLNCY